MLFERAQTALEEDPMIRDHSLITTHTENGVITLGGVVHSSQEQQRVENAVRTTLTNAGIKFERIENKVTVS
jgi:osmotically-inducible protein OsmY